MREVLVQARADSACLHLETGEIIGRPGTFVVSERWRSGTDNLNRVLRLPYFRRYLERTEPVYAVPWTLVVLTPIAD